MIALPALAIVTAAGYGGGIGFLHHRHLVWLAGRSGTAASVLLGAAQRFVLTGAAFALGFGALHLAPLPLLAGFAAVRLARVAP